MIEAGYIVTTGWDRIEEHCRGIFLQKRSRGRVLYSHGIIQSERLDFLNLTRTMEAVEPRSCGILRYDRELSM